MKSRKEYIIKMSQMMFYKNGYEKTSIESITKEVGIAKSTFYHHFKSKVELLDAIIGKVFEDIETKLDNLLEDSNLNALKKMQSFFLIITTWKTENLDFLLSIIRDYFKDENLVLRQKIASSNFQRLSAYLKTILIEGAKEKIFKNRYERGLEEIILSIIIFQNENLGQLINSRQIVKIDSSVLVAKYQLIEKVVKQIIGLTTEEPVMFEEKTIKFWMDKIKEVLSEKTSNSS